MDRGSTLSDTWQRFQGEHFPENPLLETYRRFVGEVRYGPWEKPVPKHKARRRRRSLAFRHPSIEEPDRVPAGNCDPQEMRTAFIDVDPRPQSDFREELARGRAAGRVDAGSVRFRIPAGADRANARLPDEFGGR